MTTLYIKTVKCSVCGYKNNLTVIGSTNSIGSPDLDLRPAEMQRSTMDKWVQECKNCHYVAYDLSSKCKISKLYIKSDEYLKNDGYKFKSDLCSRFYRHHKIMIILGDIENAFNSLHWAAWECDDLNDNVTAKAMRELCIPLITSLISIKKGERKYEFQLIKADLLRRAGRFDELIAAYENIKFKDDTMNNVLKFQLIKAKKHDISCFTIEDALSFCHGAQN